MFGPALAQKHFQQVAETAEVALAQHDEAARRSMQRFRFSDDGRRLRVRCSPLARREEPRGGGDIGGRGAQHTQDVLL